MVYLAACDYVPPLHYASQNVLSLEEGDAIIIVDDSHSTARLDAIRWLVGYRHGTVGWVRSDLVYMAPEYIIKPLNPLTDERDLGASKRDRVRGVTLPSLRTTPARPGRHIVQCKRRLMQVREGAARVE